MREGSCVNPKLKHIVEWWASEQRDLAQQPEDEGAGDMSSP